MMPPTETRSSLAPAGIYSAYGLQLESTFPLLTRRQAQAFLPRVRAELMAGDRLLGAYEGITDSPILAATMSDGASLSVFRTDDGGHLVRFDDRGLFLISADGRSVACSRSVPDDDPSWHRVLLDWVMYCVASLRGSQALHASGAAVADKIVAFCALSGGGKTSVLAELISAGAGLICDDVLCLSRAEGQIFGHSGPAFLNVVGFTGLVPVGERVTIGNERWIHVPDVPSVRMPLGAVFILDRAERHTVLSARDASLLDLRPHSIGLSGSDDAELARFELMADVVSQIPVRTLDIPISSSPSDIAAFVMELLDLDSKGRT